ncbi:helix-turn-helix domain-containing protein [Streptomyces sp. NPDC056470]|uniref:helix-turn-helix domain-containing protein n=1 Tax=Streptomyces sp. NPDC056470 TaxID=3345831 RepID=UPI00369F05D6
MPITVDIDVMMARRKMSVGELAERVGITPANLAVLKNGRAKAVRFTTLEALCEVLECQPGDLLRWAPGDAEPDPEPAAGRPGPAAEVEPAAAAEPAADVEPAAEAQA